jgi:hypothetical protein
MCTGDSFCSTSVLRDAIGNSRGQPVSVLPLPSNGGCAPTCTCNGPELRTGPHEHRSCRQRGPARQGGSPLTAVATLPREPAAGRLQTHPRPTRASDGHVPVGAFVAGTRSLIVTNRPAPPVASRPCHHCLAAARLAVATPTCTPLPL